MVELIVIPEMLSIVDQLIVLEQSSKLILVGEGTKRWGLLFHFLLDLDHQIYIYYHERITAIYL